MITLKEWVDRCGMVHDAIKKAEQCKPFDAGNNGLKQGLVNGALSRLKLAMAEPYSSNNSQTMSVRLKWLDDAESLALEVLELGKEPEPENKVTLQFSPPVVTEKRSKPEFKKKRYGRIYEHVAENAEICPIFHVRTIKADVRDEQTGKDKTIAITTRKQCSLDTDKGRFEAVRDYMERMDENNTEQVKRLDRWWHKYALKGGGKVLGEWTLTDDKGEPYTFKLVQDGGIEDWEEIPVI